MPESSLGKTLLREPALVALACLPAFAQIIRVLVWDERQPEQKTAYADFVGNQIAGHLKQLPGITVLNSVGLDDPAHGLGNSILDNTDVLIWWGHIRQGEIP